MEKVFRPFMCRGVWRRMKRKMGKREKVMVTVMITMSMRRTRDCYQLLPPPLLILLLLLAGAIVINLLPPRAGLTTTIQHKAVPIAFPLYHTHRHTHTHTHAHTRTHTHTHTHTDTHTHTHTHPHTHTHTLSALSNY